MLIVARRKSAILSQNRETGKIKEREVKDMSIEALGIKETDTGKPKRKKLTAQEKWKIFLETSAKDAPVGEILRR